MAETWFVLSVITLLLWGIWGLLEKIALNTLSWQQTFIIASFGIISTVLIFFLFTRPQISISQGFYYAVLGGLIGGLGVILFYYALSQGKASVVIPLTALYPVVTVILSFLILQEKITLVQGVGILFALASIFLLSL